MQKIRLAASATLCLLAASTARTQTLSLQPFATGLSGVVAITHAGDGSGRLFFTQQGGQIRIHNGTSVLPTAFLDIDPLVRSGGEEGLLSTAFHPQYASNGFFFVYYTNNNGDQVIARYTRSAGNANVADPSTAKIIITIPHPNEDNHNGGPAPGSAQRRLPVHRPGRRRRGRGRTRTIGNGQDLTVLSSERCCASTSTPSSPR